MAYRSELKQFRTREELLQVPRMGKKAFEQAAGFLRIRESQNQLDNTAVHPERYRLVQKMLKDHQITLDEITTKTDLLDTIDLHKYCTDEVGLPTLQDIITELKKPGLDPRGAAQTVQFSSHVRSINDLKIGMKLNGVVNNLTKFGAFIDLGIKESALLHISQIVNRFISDPSEVLSLQQEVEVTVIDIDQVRKRVSLTMKDG